MPLCVFCSSRRARQQPRSRGTSAPFWTCPRLRLFEGPHTARVSRTVLFRACLAFRYKPHNSELSISVRRLVCCLDTRKSERHGPSSRCLIPQDNERNVL